MLRSIILKRVDAAEVRAGVPLDYLRFIANASLRSFLRFAKVVPFATKRKRLPTALHHLIALVATMAEDCGSCVQTQVNHALEDGVEPGLLKCVLRYEDEKMKLPDMRAAVALARGIVNRDPDLEGHRAVVREAWGDAGLVELAFAVAGARVFTTTKRALGFESPCDLSAIQLGPDIPDPLARREQS